MTQGHRMRDSACGLLNRGRYIEPTDPPPASAARVQYLGQLPYILYVPTWVGIYLGRLRTYVPSYLGTYLRICISYFVGTWHAQKWACLVISNVLLQRHVR